MKKKIYFVSEFKMYSEATDKKQNFAKAMEAAYVNGFVSLS